MFWEGTLEFIGEVASALISGSESAAQEKSKQPQRPQAQSGTPDKDRTQEAGDPCGTRQRDGSMAPVTVDLTQEDTVSEDDELVIVAAGPAPRRSEPSSSWNPVYRAVVQNPSPRAAQGSAAPALVSRPAQPSNGSPASKPPARHENQETPTKSTRFAPVADEFRPLAPQLQFQPQVPFLPQSQPLQPALSSRSTQPPPQLPPQTYFQPPKSLNQLQDPFQNPAPQTSQNLFHQQHTPKAETPRKMDWTVDKIAAKLASFEERVERDHVRLVEYLLEETEMKAPEKKHLSAVNHFAGMKSLALDPGVPPPEGTQTMAVKFKAGNS